MLAVHVQCLLHFASINWQSQHGAADFKSQYKKCKAEPRPRTDKIWLKEACLDPIE